MRPATIALSTLALLAVSGSGCGSNGASADSGSHADATAADRAVTYDATPSDGSVDTGTDTSLMDGTSPEPAGDTGVLLADDAGPVPDVPPGDASVLAASCTGSGGLLSTASCCQSASDFPATCALGACGCGPGSSHTVIVCVCPGGCWNGTMCQSEGGGF